MLFRRKVTEPPRRQVHARPVRMQKGAERRVQASYSGPLLRWRANPEARRMRQVTCLGQRLPDSSGAADTLGSLTGFCVATRSELLALVPFLQHQLFFFLELGILREATWTLASCSREQILPISIVQKLKSNYVVSSLLVSFLIPPAFGLSFSAQVCWFWSGHATNKFLLASIFTPLTRDI